MVRVRPHQVCKGTFVWNLLDSFDLSDIVDVLQGRREASVDTENFPVDDRRERQVVKQVCELLPHNETAILFLALNLKAVHLRDLT